MSARDRLRTVLDERRWHDYASSATSIFLRRQPFRETPR